MFFVDTRTLNTTRNGERIHMLKMCSGSQALHQGFTSLKEARNAVTNVFDSEMNFFYEDLDSSNPTVDLPTWQPVERLSGPDLAQTEQVTKLLS
jgi:hypothetical protein